MLNWETWNGRLLVVWGPTESVCWDTPKPRLYIWSYASPMLGGARNNCGKQFQHEWTDKEARNHINWLELMAVRLALLQLASPRGTVQLFLDNITSIALIKKMGETYSPALCKESLLLWCQAIERKLRILPPQWLASEENTEADFLSRNLLQRLNSKLASTEFWWVCQR